jgi:hypothetical protein
MFFRSRYGIYPLAGVGFARFLTFFCPLMLFVLVLARAFYPAPALLRYLWVGQIVLQSLSIGFALILMLVGPWQNRLAGLWLGIVVCVLFYFMTPLVSWAARF